MLARKLVSFNSLFRPIFGVFSFSTSIYNNLFKSNYHLKGPKNFQKYEQAARLSKAKDIAIITDTAAKLNPLREKVIKYFPKKIPTPQEKHPSVLQYVKNYVELQKLVQKSEMNNQWVWNIIGWYNFTSMYGQLYWELITTTSQEQLRNLITALNMMVIQPNEQFDRILNEIYQTTNYQQFYKTLSPNLQLEFLRSLQNVIKGPRTYSKRRYFEWYLRHHLESLLKNLDLNNDQEMSNIIWLLQAAVKQLCDDDILIGKVQKYLLTVRAVLKHEDLQRFINIYKVKGRINEVIYEEYLKEYILNNKMNTFDGVIDIFQFYVYSEVEDEQLLTAIYDKLTTIKSISEISPKSAEKLHILSHFEKIINNQLQLTDTLTNQLDSMCSNKKLQGENQNNLDSLALKSPKVKNNTEIFKSKCLTERTEDLTPVNQEQIDILEATNILKNVPSNLRDSNTYGNNKFCCYHLEYCLQSKTTSEIVVFQLSSINNILNSGRLVRQMHVRDKILKHYGIRVHYPNSFGLKTKGKLSEEDFMISKKYTLGRI